MLSLTAFHETFHWLGKQGKLGARFQQTLIDNIISYLKRSEDHDYETIRQQRLDLGYSEDKVDEEIAAQYFGTILAEKEFQKYAAEQDAPLWKKIIDHVKAFIEDIRNRIEQRFGSDRAVQAALMSDVEFIERQVKAFDIMLDAVLEERAKGSTETEAGTDYSFAGIWSKTADKTMLEQAQEMEEDGATSEEIRQATGWFRGYDGKWRYEIDDSRVKIDLNGLYMRNPDVRRYNELMRKFLYDMPTQEEIEEIKALEPNIKGVRMKPETLGDMISHSELLNAYPELADLSVKFGKLDDATGIYQPGSREIYIHEDLLKDTDRMKRTLLHEVQHAIQHIEGFAHGANELYWARTVRPEELKEKAEAEIREVMKNVPKDLQNKYYRYKELDRVLTDILFADEMDEEKYAHYEGIQDALYEELYRHEWFKQLRYAESILDDPRAAYTALYERTAGEIEARDTAARADLTADQRKEKRPDIDRTDVVFADKKTDYSVDLSDYDKPVSRKDVYDLRAVITTQKSVNDFTQKDINATAKWAHKYYQQMGVKSPFFRAWFGDWRAYDISPVQVANKKGAARGDVNNEDTGWNIAVSGKIFHESRHEAKGNQSALPYLTIIEDIVKNAVLLDTQTMAKGDEKSENSILMHSLYAIANIGNGPELLKLYVEEMFDPNASDSNFRSYQLQNIEKKQSGVQGSQNTANLITQTAYANTVADLYELVKQKDKNFVAGRKVDNLLLNADGTPKVFYHGTSSNFTKFDITQARSWEGSPDYDLPGFYFSLDRQIASDYGDTQEYYLAANKIWRESVDGAVYDLKKKYGSFRSAYDELVKRGYDMVIYDEDLGEGEEEYIVLKPENIKSAETGTNKENIGTFSKYEDDTLWSVDVDSAAEELTERIRMQDERAAETLDVMRDLVEKTVGVADKRLNRQAYAKLADKYLLTREGNEGKLKKAQVDEFVKKLERIDGLMTTAENKRTPLRR